MKQAEKIGIAIMIMSAPYIPEEGVRGGLGVILFFTGWLLFIIQFPHKGAEHECRECGTKIQKNQKRCLVCGTQN